MSISLLTALPILGPTVAPPTAVVSATQVPVEQRGHRSVVRPWSEVADGHATVQNPASIGAAQFLRGQARLGATTQVATVRGARLSVGGALGKRFDVDGLEPLDPWGAGLTTMDGVVGAEAPIGPVDLGVAARIPLVGLLSTAESHLSRPGIAVQPKGVFLGTKLSGALLGQARWVMAMEADYAAHARDQGVRWASSIGVRLAR